MWNCWIIFGGEQKVKGGPAYIMKYIFFALLCFYCLGAAAQTSVKILSWNLKDFGRSKDGAEINFIANTVKAYDLIAIQEVVAGSSGSQAVARLVDALNRSGGKWDYAVSEITSGSSLHKAERYAFIWEAKKVTKVGRPWLEQKYGLLIEREPYYGRFKIADRTFTLVNFHAIPKSRQPETEIKYFKFLPESYPDDNLIFCGDFNVPASHTVFNPLKKMGYTAMLKGQKTSLRQQCINGDCLASEFDNFYFNPSMIKLLNGGVIHFYRDFIDLKAARKLSDHIPVFVVYQL